MSFNGNHEMFLYHYTNKEDFHKILNDHILRKSVNGKHGPGVYLTSLSPKNGREKIKKNNLDGAYCNPKYDDKTEEHYFKFNKEDLCGVKYIKNKGNRDIWLYSKDINLKNISYFYGSTDNNDEEQYNNLPFVGHRNRKLGTPLVSNNYRNSDYILDNVNEKFSSSSDDVDNHSWFSRSAAVERNQYTTRTFQDYNQQRDFCETSFHSSQLQQSKSDDNGLDGIVAGTAAVIAIGAAAFGLFAAFRQARQNSQQ